MFFKVSDNQYGGPSLATAGLLVFYLPQIQIADFASLINFYVIIIIFILLFALNEPTRCRPTVKLK